MATRIKDINATATAPASDDYLVIDGASVGTRKILATDVGGAKEIDFTTSLTPSLDSRGVSAYYAIVTPSQSSNLTIANGLQIKAYLAGSTGAYPLIVSYCGVGTSTFNVTLKSVNGNTQNTSSTTISGTLHIIAPFEISSVTQGM